MINLLPPEEKRKLQKERVRRITVFFWSLALALLALVVVFFLAINIYLNQRTQFYQKELKNEEGKIGQEEVAKTRERIKETNKILAELNSFYQGKVYYFEIIYKIGQTLPEEIYLSSASFISEEKAIEASITGLASTREDLFELKKAMEKVFEKVSFPPSNWVKPTDIDFFVDFKIFL